MCSGCITTSSQSPKNLGGYSKGMEFLTLQKMVVIKVNDGLAGSRFALSAIGRSGLNRSPYPSMLYGASSEVVAKYCDVEGLCIKNPEGIVAVIPKGVSLVVTNIKWRQGQNIWFGHHDDIVIFAKAPVEIEGITRIIDITDLSVQMIPKTPSYPEEILYAPDPFLLKQKL
jgi:hypothetical protein